MKFIHLTDTHLVPSKQALWGLDPAWLLRRAVESINRCHADATFCVVTGDLTHYGQKEAYHALADELSKLKIPCYQILGNHDHRETYISVFRSSNTDGNGFVQYVRSIGVLGRFLFLDTNEPELHHGGFCEKRAEWLRAQGVDRPERIVLPKQVHGDRIWRVTSQDAGSRAPQAYTGNEEFRTLVDGLFSSLHTLRQALGAHAPDQIVKAVRALKPAYARLFVRFG